MDRSVPDFALGGLHEVGKICIRLNVETIFYWTHLQFRLDSLSVINENYKNLQLHKLSPWLQCLKIFIK